MRKTRSAFAIFSLAAMLVGGISADALAASADCGRGPPAWWNAPRVSHTYSTSYGSGYRHSHEFAAQRRYTVRHFTPAKQSYRQRHHRW